jgi:signal transduction histidine kinase
VYTVVSAKPQQTVPSVTADRVRVWVVGPVFTVITAGCVLALGALAQFQNVSHLGAHAPCAIQSAIFIPALVVFALQLLVGVRNNAAALRTSKQLLAERAAQLAASRSRLITVADEERRRLERDLHDGAQQHLVALAVLIQLARTAGHDRYQPLLTEASGLLETAVAEIRRLAHGIYPPLLVSGGLAQALPAVAARAAVPVRLDLQGLGRHPAPIETALYYCCTEALQTTATITAHADDRMLTLTISDTGRGFDPATTGTGLTNMTDRLAAIGGQLVIDSAPGSNTRITATVAAAVQPYRNALDTEMTEHLGYGTHDPIGRGSDNSRNASRAIRSSPRSGRWTSRMPRDTKSVLSRRSSMSTSAG